MEILKWRDSYKTGIEQMDTQHQQLITLINELYLAIRVKESSESLDNILKNLFEYADQHLKDEETLLEEHNYPELAEQKTSHISYHESIKQLQETAETDKVAATLQMYTFLRKWWINHIVIEDKKYGPFLQEKGVQ